MSLPLSQQIESLLFYKTEPMAKKQIAKLLNVEESAVADALTELEQALADRGVVLVRNDDDVMLGTHPDTHAVIEQLRKDELGTELTRAALETLTIVAYRNGVTKSEIDYIRGVNSNFILRNLMMRGLVERVPNPNDKRSPLYRPTIDTLSYLGITSVEELPDFNNLKQQLDSIHEEFETVQTADTENA